MQHISRIERCKSLFVFALATDQITVSTDIARGLQDMNRDVQEIQILAQNTSLTVRDIKNLIQSKGLSVQDIGKLLQNTNLTMHETQSLTRQTNITACDTQKLMRNTNLVIQDIRSDISRTSLAIDDLQTRTGSLCATEGIDRKEAKRREVLKWLSLDDFGRKHVEISNRRQLNTGGWVMRTPQFQRWFKGRKDRRLLWGYGIPGAGKTFLISSIIDHLQAQSALGGYGVAHIYFDYKEEDRQTPTYVLASLVKQLACQIAHLPAAIEDLFNKRESEGKRPTVEELYSALLSIAKSFSQVFLLFDALDEYNYNNQREELLELFHRMCEPETGISVFLTSRPHPEDIQDSFRDVARIEILAKEDDVRVYIQEKISKTPRAKRLIRQSNLREKIICELVDCAQGMFLLVHFHIEYLCQQTTTKQILVALDRLKSSASEERPLDPTYDRAMGNVRRQDRGCTELAFKVFSWLVKARRTLSVDEIQVAVSVEQGRYELDDQDLPDRAILLDVCAGLVIIDEESMTVRLAHYTVQDYLLRTSAIPEDAELQIAIACTTYLSFDTFAEGACSSNESLKTRNQSYPLFDYAVHQLSAHLKACNEDLSADMVLRFVQSPRNISSYMQGLHFPADRWKSSSYDNYPKGRSPLHIAAALGHRVVAKLLLDGGAGVLVLDNQKKTPLHIAALEGQEAMIKLLLKEGADPSLPDHYDQTVLHIAASQGHIAVARLLLENGVDISIPDSLGYTALHNAAFEKHLEMIQLLLDNGANASAQKNNGRTALHTAVYQGNEAVARLLLVNGADSSIQDNNGLTALHLATSKLNKTMIQLLVKNGASPFIPNNAGRTVWDLATSMQGGDIVQYLIKRRVDDSMTDSTDRTVFHMAVLEGHLAAVQFLIENGADHPILDSMGRTALHIAASQGLLEVVNLLLPLEGTDHSIQNNEGQTALHIAVSEGFSEVARLLLWDGADHTILDNAGQTALHIAASKGSLELAHLLLWNKADHSILDSSGRTALHIAASKGSFEVAYLLLDSGADDSIRDNTGQTALQTAVTRCHRQIVELLEKG